MTWMSCPYVEERIQEIFRGDLELRDFNPQGWHGHHDAFTVQRAA
jgi:hypothetical protein